jgi:hypothetical protein
MFMCLNYWVLLIMYVFKYKPLGFSVNWQYNAVRSVDISYFHGSQFITVRDILVIKRRPAFLQSGRTVCTGKEGSVGFQYLNNPVWLKSIHMFQSQFSGFHSLTVDISTSSWGFILCSNSTMKDNTLVCILGISVLWLQKDFFQVRHKSFSVLYANTEQNILRT